MSSGGGGAGAVVRQGQLRKLKTMKKKYFVLRAETVDCSARLEYYESEKKFRAGASPKRVLPLKSCYNIMRRLDLKQKHVIALFTREEQFCVVADNEQDLHAWLTAILKQHRVDDVSQELLHPIQHVWQVNVQKKGLGASKNIQGLYNLCLADKTITLVKIKSQNNVISDLGIPERVEYSLRNVRRCGDSECFFYMEVGRQTVTGAGELWMLSDDSNIAQSMHSTIYHAMRNCAKEREHERDHIILPKCTENTLITRRQTYSDGQGKAGLANEKGLCAGACISIRQCVCAGGTYSIDDSAAALAPITPLNLPAHNAENEPSNNPLKDKPAESKTRLIKHHRTVSLPTGCPLFQEPLKIVHERSWSSPLTGEEVDRALVEKAVVHSSCKAINGNDVGGGKKQWSRRASTGTRWSKLSPAHTKNNSTLRNRCDSMPSRPCSSFEVERPAPRHNDFEGAEPERDETDALAEWTRTPRIPEEPDCCDISKDLMNTSIRGGSVQHSRTSSFGVEEGGYLPMAPAHDALGGLVSASSGSVCSGTPSTDPRFSEYQLEPATSHIGMEWRPPRAYSVGSRPAPSRAQGSQAGDAGGAAGGGGRHRAYSVGARRRPVLAPSSAPTSRHAPRASADDLMELDFSNNSPANKASISRTPPATIFTDRPKMNVDEYVDMSPQQNAGYVEMLPGKSLAHPLPLSISLPRTPPSTPVPVATTPDGYVEMTYGRAATKPIAINAIKTAPQMASSPPHLASKIASSPPHMASSPEDARRRRLKDMRTPHGSQTIFPLSLDSPASPPDGETDDLEEDAPHHPLSTVREISEEGGRRSPDLPVVKRSPDASSSPQYVQLVKPGAKLSSSKTPEPRDELSCNPTATKTIARIVDPVDCRADSSATLVLAGGGQPARFSIGDDKRSPPPLASLPPPASPGVSPSPSPSPSACNAPLNYVSLDLEPRKATAASTPRTYTQIDFVRSEKLHAADST